MTITLTDDEYARLSAEAARHAKPVEALLHEVLDQGLVQRLRQSASGARPLTARELMEKLYREGKILNVPSQQPLTEHEKAERERLAQALSGGTPLSEMVIED